MSDLLFASRAEIEAVQGRHFAETMLRVNEGHPYYRRILGEKGLRAEDFSSLGDLHKLPITRKQDYMREPAAFRISNPRLPEEMQAVWDVMYTTGSTAGQPTPFVSTSFDFFRILELNRNMLRLRGVRSDDVIANLFPLTARPHGAFIRTLHAAASINVRVVAALPGNPSPYFTLGHALDEVVEIVSRSRASILWGVPSYVRRVVARAEEIGADLRAVRLAFVTGEGLGEPARADLTAALRRIGAPDAWVSISYGSTEMQGGMVECAAGPGYHNPAPDQFHICIVDPETGAPVADGAPGLVTLTHLQRTGTVLLRYALGDTSVLSRERCPHCGSWTDRLVAMPRRADALVKIKGTLVNPDVLVQAAEAVLQGAEFQFTITRNADGSDALTVKLADGASGERVVQAVKQAAGVTPALQIVSAAAFADPSRSWKTKRVVDLRN
ncbi:MAG TPA: AMP-binding protein [Burkholderiales bacterium]